MLVLKWGLCFILIAFKLSSQGLETEGRDAEALFFAGRLRESAASYRALLDEHMTATQRQLVQFNLATVLVEESEWAQADVLYSTLVQEGTKPELRQAAATNQAVLHLRRGLSFLDNAGELELSEAYQRAIEALQSGLAAIDTASEAERSISVRRGLEWEGESTSIADARQALKAVLLTAIDKQRILNLEQLSYTEGLELLTAELHALQSLLEDLGLHAPDLDLQMRHLIAQAREASQLLPYWQRTNERLDEEIAALVLEKARLEEKGLSELVQVKTEEIDGLKQQRLLLSEAENQHRVALDWMREGQVWKARSQEAIAVISLLFIQELEAKRDVLSAVLRQRIMLADRAKQNRLPSGMQQSLADEDETLLSFAYMLTEQQKRILNTELNALEASNGMVLENLRVRVAVLSLLSEWLGRSSESDTQKYKQAIENSTLYRQSTLEEGGILLAIQKSLEHEVDWEVLMTELRVLLKRFELRVDSSTTPERADHARTVLGRALILHQDDKAKLGEIVEEALLVWDPEAMLRAHLQELINLYNKALANDPPKNGRVTALEEPHSQIERWLKELQELDSGALIYRSLEKTMARARESTRFAQRALSEHQDDTAIVFLQDAREDVHVAQASLRKLAGLEPKAILADGIQAQRHALRANQVLQQMANDETTAAQLERLLKWSQQRVLEQVVQFRAGVAELLGVDLDSEAEGVSSPWDEVLPLFDAGQRQADGARVRLQETQPELEQALGQQTQAYRLWQEALDKLEPPSDDDDQGGDDLNEDQEDGSGSDNDAEAEDGDPDKGQMGAQQVLQLLQQMDRDDVLDDGEKNKSVKQGLRPW